jgi:hypothetical protein
MNMNYRFNSSDSHSSSSSIEEDNNERKSSSSHFKNHDSDSSLPDDNNEITFNRNNGSCVDGEMSSDSSMENLGQAIDNLRLLTFADLNKRNMKELKEMLKARKMRVGGNKRDLIMRLLGSEVDADPDADADTDLTKWTAKQLRERLKQNNMPTGGKKEQLIKRIEGTENIDKGTHAYFDRYTSAELVEILKSQNRDTGGTKDDLISRLLGKEPPMPKEGWANSEDRELLFKALEKQGPTSLRFKTAQEVHLKQPYNRWPYYRFKQYFKDALIAVLKDESIAAQDNRDFEALFNKNPRPELTSRG